MITRTPALAAGCAAFCLVAILNCGGYRYGVGDQAFYVPAVVQHLDPQLFPRDRAILHAQDRFMLYDDAIAALAGATGASVPALFFAAYLASLVALFGAVAAIGRVLFQSWWTVTLLAALMTLRHRITQTGANSLESYFQPRLLAFALGAWAIAAFLRGRNLAAVVLVAIAFAVHPTTALWFDIWLGVALAVSAPRWRIPVVAGVGAGAIAASWAVTLGPLQGHLAIMDPEWASAVAGKDYIFSSDWTASFWLANMSYLPIATGIHALRRRRGVAQPCEAGLLAGGAALVVLFLFVWPLMAANVALALQIQISRVFWVLDFLAAVYIAWLLAETSSSPLVRRTVVAVFVAAAVGRGIYVFGVERAGSAIVRVGLPQDNWHDAMAWMARTRPDAYVLADPAHAWKYGTSVRVAGERDVYLEEVKDLALALYSREVAIESLRRIRDVQGFDAMTAEELGGLAARYGLDYLVIDRDVDLPMAYRNQQFRIYEFR